MIARIRSMRTFDKKSRFQADSLPEIRQGLDQLAFDLKKQTVGTRRASEGHVANAAILVLLSMPEEERRAATIEAFAKLNALLAIDDPEGQAEDVERIIYGERIRVGVPTTSKSPAPKKPGRTA